MTLHYKSNHPLMVKENTAKNHFLRAKSLSSNDNMLNRSCDKISSLLLANGYPSRVIDVIKHRVFNVNITSSSPPLSRTRSNKKLYLTLPFLDEKLATRCKKIIKKSELDNNILVSWKPGPSLKSFLVSLQLTPPKCLKNCLSCAKTAVDSYTKCDSRLFVYELKCSVCGAAYIVLPLSA